MEAKVLDIIREGSSICYLANVELDTYVLNLPDNYKEYEVQREIVKNSYLDDLVLTILLTRELVCKESYLSFTEEGSNEFGISSQLS